LWYENTNRGYISYHILFYILVPSSIGQKTHILWIILNTTNETKCNPLCSYAKGKVEYSNGFRLLRIENDIPTKNTIYLENCEIFKYI